MRRRVTHVLPWSVAALLVAGPACGRAAPPQASAPSISPAAVATSAPTAPPTVEPTATLVPTPEPTATLEPTAPPAAAAAATPQLVAPPSGVVVNAGLAGSAGNCMPGVAPGLPPASSAAPLQPGQPGVLRPVIVQIDNAADARPPLHLSEAAAVYEYVAEGGVTRFSALFTQEDVGQIAPIRSARLISLELARQFDALLVYHGASIGVQDRIWGGGIDFVSFNAPDAGSVGWRLPDRVIPHNSVSTLPAMRQYATAHKVPTRVSAWPDFPRGDPPPAESGTPVTQLAVGFSGPDGAPWPAYRAEFRYMPQEGRYARSIGGIAHVDGATGQRLSAETVVVQVAPVEVTDIVEDVLGSLSLDYQLIGEGTAYFLRGGVRWQGCWRRPSAFEPATFYGPDGTPFPFGAGPIWIEEASPITPLTWGE